MLASIRHHHKKAQDTTDKDLYLCSCTYFAISGRCEHEQAVHTHLGTGGLDARIVGERPGRGRKAKQTPPLGPSARGLTSAELHGRRQTHAKDEEEKRTKRLKAMALLPQAPSTNVVLPGVGVENVTDASAEPIPAAARASSSASASGPACSRVRSLLSTCTTDFTLIERALQRHCLPDRTTVYYHKNDEATCSALENSWSVQLIVCTDHVLKQKAETTTSADCQTFPSFSLAQCHTWTNLDNRMLCSLVQDELATD
jgi:hypothetical protein